MEELRRVYEGVTGARLNPSAFRRKVLDQSIVVPADAAPRRGGRRPARLFRLASPRLSEFDRTI